MTEKSTHIINSIFVYFFLALGIIFCIVGGYLGLQLATNTYSPAWEETRCDYLAMEPAVAPEKTSPELPRETPEEKQKRYEECLKSVEKTRALAKSRTTRDSAFFLITGIVLVAVFSRKTHLR